MIVLTLQLHQNESTVLNFAKLTVNDLADFYEQQFLKPAEYVDGRKIAGLREFKRPLACVKLIREYFGKAGFVYLCCDVSAPRQVSGAGHFSNL